MSDPEWLQQARAEGRITEGPTARIVAESPQSRPVARKRGQKPLGRWQFYLCVVVAVKTPSSLNSREHWSVRQRRVASERKATREALHRIAFKSSLFTDLETRLSVKLTRLGGGKMDDDNLPGSLKAIRDEVAAWVDMDDGSDWFVWSYAQEPACKAIGVRIEFELAAERPKE